MLDGAPHGATLHYANTSEPLRFFFETNPDYRKAEALTGRPESRATFVVTNEEEMKTLQLDGTVRLCSSEENDTYQKVYFLKFPEKLGKWPYNLRFVFVPHWWRFTDWQSPSGKLILLSTDS